MQDLFCKVIDIFLLSRNVYCVKLHSPDLNQVDYAAGQYLMLQVASGQWVPFSIANAPEEKTHLELHIRYLPGHQLVESIIQQFKSKKRAHIQLPMGRCVLRESKRNVIFIAGGTGLSPIKAMLESAFKNHIQRTFYLFWGVKTSKDFYLLDEVNHWQQQFKNFQFTPVISETGSDDEKWNGETGLVHQIAMKKINNIQEYDIYLSGSEMMVLNVYQDLMNIKVPKSQLFSDMLDIKRDMGEDL